MTGSRARGRTARPATANPVQRHGRPQCARRPARSRRRDRQAVGSAGANRGPLSRRQRGLRSLRELLHQGHAAGRRPGGLDPPHGAQAPGRGAHRLDLVHALRRRRGRAAGDEGHRAGGRGLGAGGRLHRGRRRACSSPGARGARCEHARARGELGPALRGRAGGLPAPALRVPLRRAAAEDQVPLPLSRRPLLGRGDGRRRAARARGLAGDDRPQLGRRARRALDLDPGERVRRRRRATSTPRSAGSRSAR